jgi:Mg2+ and Co2+ transporter CorA
LTKNIEDFDDDFGFSTVDIEEIISYNQETTDKLNAENAELTQRAISELTRRIDKIIASIEKLLTNLSKNPHPELIKWPNRIERIAEFREKLERIRRGEE